MSVHPVHNIQNPKRTIDGLVFASTRDRHAFQPDLAAMLGFVDIFSSRISRPAAIKALRAQEPLRNPSGLVIYPAYAYVACKSSSADFRLPDGLIIHQRPLQVDNMCLWDRIEAIDRPGTFRLGPCFRHRSAPGSKGCELDGTRFVLAEEPSKKEWDLWKVVGYPQEMKAYNVMPSDGGRDMYVSPEGILVVGVGVQGGRGTKRPRYSYIPQTDLSGQISGLETGDLRSRETDSPVHDKKSDDNDSTLDTPVAAPAGLKERRTKDAAPSISALRDSGDAITPRPAEQNDPLSPAIPSLLVRIPITTGQARDARPSQHPSSRESPSSSSVLLGPSSARQDGLSAQRFPVRIVGPSFGRTENEASSSAASSKMPVGMKRGSQYPSDSSSDAPGLARVNGQLPAGLAQLGDLVGRLEERQKAIQLAGEARVDVDPTGQSIRSADANSINDPNAVMRDSVSAQDVELLRTVYEAQSREHTELQATIVGLEQEREALRGDKRKMKDDREKMKKKVIEARGERDGIHATLYALREDHQNELKAVHERTIRSLSNLKRQYDVEKETYVAEANKSAASLRNSEKEAGLMQRKWAAAEARFQTALSEANLQHCEAEGRLAAARGSDDMRQELEDLRRENEGLRTDVEYKKHRIDRLEARVRDLASSLGTERVARIKASRMLGRLAESLERGYKDLTSQEDEEDNCEESMDEEGEERDQATPALHSRSQVSTRALSRGARAHSRHLDNWSLGEAAATRSDSDRLNGRDDPEVRSKATRFTHSTDDRDSVTRGGAAEPSDEDSRIITSRPAGIWELGMGGRNVSHDATTRNVDTISVGGRVPLTAARAP